MDLKILTEEMKEKRGRLKISFKDGIFVSRYYPFGQVMPYSVGCAKDSLASLNHLEENLNRYSPGRIADLGARGGENINYVDKWILGGTSFVQLRYDSGKFEFSATGTTKLKFSDVNPPTLIGTGKDIKTSYLDLDSILKNFYD